MRSVSHVEEEIEGQNPHQLKPVTQHFESDMVNLLILSERKLDICVKNALDERTEREESKVYILSFNGPSFSGWRAGHLGTCNCSAIPSSLKMVT